MTQSTCLGPECRQAVADRAAVALFTPDGTWRKFCDLDCLNQWYLATLAQILADTNGTA